MIFSHRMKICADFHAAGKYRAPGANIVNLFHSDFPMESIYLPVLKLLKNIKKVSPAQPTNENTRKMFAIKTTIFRFLGFSEIEKFLYPSEITFSNFWQGSEFYILHCLTC